MQSQDVALLLQLAIQDEPRVLSKNLAASLFLSQSEVSKALKRCVESGLLHIARGEKRVNRSALMEFLAHGLKYVFPPVKGSLVRGILTATSAEPLKSRFLDNGDPPSVWPTQKERFEASRSCLSIKERPRPPSAIPGSTASLPSAMPSGAEEPASATLPSSFLEMRSIADPNLPMLEDAARKLAPFLDHRLSRWLHYACLNRSWFHR